MILVALAAMALVLPPDDAIRWTAPPTCPAGGDVVRDAEGLSGFELGDAPLDVEGNVRRLDDGRWRLTLRVATTTGSQTRELDAESCEELAGVAATLIAVALQEPALGAAPDADPALEPEPEPEPEPANEGT